MIFIKNTGSIKKAGFSLSEFYQTRAHQRGFIYCPQPFNQLQSTIRQSQLDYTAWMGEYKATFD